MAFYYPELNINLPEGTELDIAIVASAFDDAFATNVVGSLENGILVIDPNNFGHPFLWCHFLEALDKYGSVGISLQHEGEFNETGRFLFTVDPPEGYIEVRYADPSLKMVWNPIRLIYEWV